MTVLSSTATSSQKAQQDAQIASVIANLPKINERLREADPSEILAWAIDNLPGLYQTTAFGVTGCVTLDQIAKISAKKAVETQQAPRHLVPLIFIDTLYHFPQTTDLANRASAHYNAPMHVYTPAGTPDVASFEQQWGHQLWEKNEETYDYVVKVEPARRAYEELGVRAVFTGRRRSQGADRANLQAVEVDETGLVKVNPLLNWSFEQVDSYVKANAVPYNTLLDIGYKSIGDWHSTSMPGANDGERSGRWKDKEGGKTECGLHVDYFKLKTRMTAQKKIREAELAAKDEARDVEEAKVRETEVVVAVPVAVAQQ